MIVAAEFGAVARLFGRLLLFEIDERMRSELTQPEVAAALLELGIDTDVLHDADLDQLAAEFLETFVQPEHGGPLVQSLWTEGSYEGDSAVAIRKLAEVGAVEFDRAAARGASHDHLGSILWLWAELRLETPELAAHLADHHLAWAGPPLRRIAGGEGFYANLAGALLRFLRDLHAWSREQTQDGEA